MSSPNTLPMVTPKFLTSQLTYSAEHGALVWNVRRPGVQFGHVAGRASYPGAVPSVVLNRTKYPVPLIVWVLERKTWPTRLPEHIDGDRNNNKIENLALPVGSGQEKFSVTDCVPTMPIHPEQQAVADWARNRPTYSFDPAKIMSQSSE